MFNPTKTRPWDIYSYKVRPGYAASSDPIDRDVLHARSLGITDWSPSDTALCEAQAEIGRKAWAETEAAIRKYNEALDRRESCDCSGRGCAKCDPNDRRHTGETSVDPGFYRPAQGRVLAQTGSAVVDVDALVSDTGTQYAILPVSVRGRQWFSIHYANKQNAAGVFRFAHEEIIVVAQRANEANLTFAKRQ